MDTGGIYSAMPSVISGGSGTSFPMKILFRNSLPFIVLGIKCKDTAISLIMDMALSLTVSVFTGQSP